MDAGGYEGALIGLGFGVLTTAVGLGASWGWLRHQAKATEETARNAARRAEELSDQIGAHREHVARNYVEHDKMDKVEARNTQMFDQLRASIENGFRQVTERIDRLRDQKWSGGPTE